MSILLSLLGIVAIFVILMDAFETIVLPRRVTRQMSLTRLFYRTTWSFWSRWVRSVFSRRRQENFLSWYGPLSLVVLIILWATGLVIAFAFVQWGSGSVIKTSEGPVDFSTYLYMSGTTFFTLGIGDVVPVTPPGRWIVALEAGMGLGFLALVIGYLPVLNQSFSRREVSISLLDARAGSPPTAGEMLRRNCHDPLMEDLQQLFHEWERWSADLMESHLSYPVLAFFRSHHDNQSWLGALTAILDTSAFVIASIEGSCERQAHRTFAITRHVIVDLAQSFNCAPRKPKQDRLPPAELTSLRVMLTGAGLTIREGKEADQELLELRRMYEPYVYSLANYLHMAIPPWTAKPGRADNWQTSTWGRSPGFRTDGLSKDPLDGYF